MAAAT
ncbi:hypothetical protein YPPY08_0986, partial [Yersinia pestis PY-08]